jgi:hypothetical protein
VEWVCGLPRFLASVEQSEVKVKVKVTFIKLITMEAIIVTCLVPKTVYHDFACTQSKNIKVL